MGIKKKTRGWERGRAGTASQSTAIKMLKSGLPYPLEVYHELMTAYLAVHGVVAVMTLALSAALIFAVWRRRFSPAGRRRLAALCLAAMSGWVGIFHQWGLMAGINFMAPAYAAGWGAQAVVLLLWAALPAPTGAPDTSPRNDGLMIALFALALYPLLALAGGAPMAALDSAGTGPNATAMLTAGLLLALRAPLWLFVIPSGWAVVAGMTAWLLAFPVDYVVPAAIAAAVWLAVRSRFSAPPQPEEDAKPGAQQKNR